ncbi:MAG TPA: hypothetical protein PK007_00205 [Candidatus Kapabacteria bacterium]|nr:hypothetical protein [Candidatus Kapabacteria bacterium]
MNFYIVHKTAEEVVVRAGDVVSLTIQGGGDTYTKAEIDSKLEQKLDKPDENDWANFLSIITGG